MIFLDRKVGQSLDVDGWPFLLQFTQKNRIATSIIMFLASTVVIKRGSKAVFGYMSKLVTVKATNNMFFLLFTVAVFTKNIYPLY